jgi:hypothetical protein
MEFVAICFVMGKHNIANYLLHGKSKLQQPAADSHLKTDTNRASLKLYLIRQGILDLLNQSASKTIWSNLTPSNSEACHGEKFTGLCQVEEDHEKTAHTCTEPSPIRSSSINQRLWLIFRDNYKKTSKPLLSLIGTIYKDNGPENICY